MATLEPEHQATQEVEEAQGLHRKRGGVQKAPVAPGVVFKVILIEEWEYLGDLKEKKPQYLVGPELLQLLTEVKNT